MLMWNSNDGAVEHRRECIHHFLDLCGGDVLAAAVDQFLEPAGDGEKAVLIALGEVAGMVPPGAQSAVGLPRLVVIAGHHAGTTNDQFTFLVRTDIGTVQIDDAYRETGKRNPAGSKDTPARWPVHHHHG